MISINIDECTVCLGKYYARQCTVVDKILSTVELSYTITSLDIIEKEWYIYKLYSPLHAAYIRLLKGVELGSTVLQWIQTSIKRDIESITFLST